jgi:hypothetical protein
MDFKIAQNFEYAGRDYWNWAAWIEGEPDRLDRIRAVAWILHPTFSPSTVEVNDRRSAFRLETSGWGTFRLRAKLKFHDGETETLSKMLRLEYPEGDEKASTKEALSSYPLSGKVFLSYSSEDEIEANRVHVALKDMGMKVFDVRSVEPGQPIDAAVRKYIRESDAVIGVFGKTVSPLVITELDQAAALEKRVFTLSPAHEKLLGLKELKKFDRYELPEDSSLMGSQLETLFRNSPFD